MTAPAGNVVTVSDSDVLVEVERAAGNLDRALSARDAAVVAAVDAGESARAVARAAGLSHPGVAKIVDRSRGG